MSLVAAIVSLSVVPAVALPVTAVADAARQDCLQLDEEQCRWQRLGFHVPVETVTVGQADLDRHTDRLSRNRWLSMQPGVQLEGRFARVADTPLGDVNLYIDGVRVDRP